MSVQPWWIISKNSTDAGNQSYSFCQKDKCPQPRYWLLTVGLCLRMINAFQSMQTVATDTLRHMQQKKDFCYFDIFTCLPPLSSASYSAPTIIAVLLIYLITVCGYLLK